MEAMVAAFSREDCAAAIVLTPGALRYLCCGVEVNLPWRRALGTSSKSTQYRWYIEINRVLTLLIQCGSNSSQDVVMKF